jgi:hypothetical protein
MHLLIFWIKIFFGRIVKFFKQSPIIFVWLIILVFAFIIGKPNITIPSNINLLIAIAVLFAVLSLIISFKNYHVLPALITFSKSNMQNKHIIFWFFVKQVLRNNIWLLIVDVFIIYEMMKTDYFAALLIITITFFSLLLSFTIMYLKNKIKTGKIQKIANKKSIISPQIKSAVHDYFSGDFLLFIILGFDLFAAIMFDFLKNAKSFYQIENRVQAMPAAAIFIGSIVIFAFMFLGIADSISKINWKFYAIINPKKFSYHVKRTILVLTSSFCFLIITFGFITFYSGILTFVKFLFCITAIMLFSIYNAFTLSNGIIMLVKSAIFTILTIWISALHPAFLLTLIIPLIIMAVLAKNDYKERYYL